MPIVKPFAHESLLAISRRLKIDICHPSSKTLCTRELTGHFKAVVLLWILFAIYVTCKFLLCGLVCSLRPCGCLLGGGWPLGSLVCGIFCVIWCPGSGVLLGCINS